MKSRIGIYLVLMIFALDGLNECGCTKKAVPPPPGYGLRERSPGLPGGGGPMDEAKWRELGINSEAQKREFLDRAAAFETRMSILTTMLIPFRNLQKRSWTKSSPF